MLFKLGEGWLGSFKFELGERNLPEHFVSFPAFGVSLYLPLKATAITFSVTFELITDWLTSESPSVQHPVMLVFI